MKTERSDVQFPLWRKKVDSSLFKYKGTTIPIWVCKMWNISKQFYHCNSKSDPELFKRMIGSPVLHKIDA